MFASTIATRNIVRSGLSSLGISPLKHSYTDKTSKLHPQRRSVVFKINRSYSDFETHRNIVSAINSEFKKFGYENETIVTTLSYSPYIYVRTIAYI